MELILFLAGVFLATFLTGRFLERIKIPWIFSALLIGLGFAVYNPFPEISQSPTFEFLAKLGMYFFLFVIGFNLNLKQIQKQKKLVIKTSLAIILAEGLAGSLFIHFVFGTPWFIAIIVGTIFATVGEAMLLPILDEFNLTKKNFGQMILGIGVIDDIIEVLIIIIVTVMLGIKAGGTHLSVLAILGFLAFLFFLTFALSKLKKQGRKMKVLAIENLFLFTIFILFLFIGIGSYAEASALGALLAGIGLRNFFPKEKVFRLMNMDLRSVAYGLFGPIFFLWVGMDVTLSSPKAIGDMFPLMAPWFAFALIVIAKILLVKITKISSTFLVARKALGNKKALVMGVALCVKFSTSIVIIKLLFENGLIGDALYSVLIASKIGFKFIIPFLLAYLITHWKLHLDDK